MVIMYIYSALTIASETTIIQTSLENFNPVMLSEKNPILIIDNIVNVDEFIKIVFSWNVLKIEKKLLKTAEDFRNNYSYMIVHNQEETTIKIHRLTAIKGKNSDEHVSIIVPAFNVLIIPFRWYVQLESKSEVNVTCINTLFGALNKFIIT